MAWSRSVAVIFRRSPSASSRKFERIGIVGSCARPRSCVAVSSFTVQILAAYGNLHLLSPPAPFSIPDLDRGSCPSSRSRSPCSASRPRLPHLAFPHPNSRCRALCPHSITTCRSPEAAAFLPPDCSHPANSMRVENRADSVNSAESFAFLFRVSLCSHQRPVSRLLADAIGAVRNQSRLGVSKVGEGIHIKQ